MTAPLPLPGPRARALRRDLAALLGDDAVSCEASEVWPLSRDAWPRALLWSNPDLAPRPPDVVVWPADVEQVCAVVRFAAERGVAVVPFGAGSGLAGGAIPSRGGIALDLRRLDAAPRIDLAARTVEVEAGVNGQRLEELLAAKGATLGHFPASIWRSTVGGWLATRSAGQLSSKHGKIEEMVLALEAVDGTGSVLRTFDGPSAGPDLNQLLLGNEGTLAVITGAKLRIWPRPSATWLRGLRFPTLRDGLAALKAVMRSGLRPAIARLSDPLDSMLERRSVHVPQPLRWVLEGAQHEAMKLALKAPSLLNKLVDALPHGVLLVLGFDGDDENDVTDEGESAIALCQAEHGEDLGALPYERWLGDSSRSYQLHVPGAFVDTMDVATTWDRLLPLYESLRRAVAPHAFVLAHFTHAYLEGCAVLFTFVGWAGEKDELEESEPRYDACWNAALGAAADAGATLSHHLGIGLAKQLYLPREHGDGMRQLRALKKAFDPHGILNPGKMLL